MTIHLIKANSLHIPLKDKSVQCVITSPPYWNLRVYESAAQIGREKTVSRFIQALTEVFKEVKRVLRDDGTCWINIGDKCASGKGKSNNPGGNSSSYGIQAKQAKALPLHRGNISDLKKDGLKPKDLVGIPWRLVFSLLDDGWHFRSEIIWHKPNTTPESVTDRPTKSHEQVFLFTKKPTYYYDHEAVMEDSVDETNDRPPGRNFKGKYEGKQSFRAPSKKRNLRDVWTIPTQSFPGAHYATFPEKLVEPCILAGTGPGHLVLDPFAGSGTVGIVAERFNRDSVLIDLSYQDLARERLNGIQKRLIY